MRLWHKDLIKILPDVLLVSQFAECGAIISNIREYKNPRDVRVRRIMEYNKSHFYLYCCMVVDEMYKREMKCPESSLVKIYNYCSDEEKQISSQIEKDGTLFFGWHEKRYMHQCFFALQELYDCEEIKLVDWERIYEYFLANYKEVTEL